LPAGYGRERFEAAVERKGKCILVCAGELDVSGIPVGEEDLLIAVDGGYAHCRALGLAPDVVIGDFDSLEGKYLPEIESGRMIRLNPVKDDTDTLAALRYGLLEGYQSFHLFAAQGGRLEHTIANLQCLSYLRNVGAAGYIWGASCVFLLLRDELVSFPAGLRGTLSIFAIDGRAEGVMEKGLKYELDDATVTGDFPIGVSNEFTGGQAQVSVRNGTLLLAVRWE